MSDATRNGKAEAPYRADLKFLFSPRFNGYVYFGIANAVALGVIAFTGTYLRDVKTIELLAIPISFVVANLAEWAAHHGPMHNKRPLMDFVFQRHVVYHHTYFPHDNMSVGSHREWGHVLFPPWAILLVVLGSAPIYFPISRQFGSNAGILFYQTGIFYYVLYEWMHLIYHMPDDHPLAGMAIFKKLRHHHLVHHHRALMDNFNFNVNFPISDYLFFTAWRKPELPAEPEYRPHDPTRPEYALREITKVEAAPREMDVA